MDPSVASFWMHQCTDQDDIDDFVSSVPFTKPNHQVGCVFIAINDNMATSSEWTIPQGSQGGGNHWSLLVINNVNNGAGGVPSYLHFDSVRHSGNLNVAKEFAEKFHRYFYPDPTSNDSSSSVQVIPAKTPQQVNGYDCGVHVIGAAKVFANFTQQQQQQQWSDDFQKKLLENILEEAVGDDPSEFCAKLRQEIVSEIRRLKDK
jgi:sentrin-specific protease 8